MLIMLGFGKKGGGKPAGPPGGTGIPTQKVMSLSSQGLSEPEIVKRLKDEGHSPIEVDRAMKDAMRTGAGSKGQPAPPHPQAQPAVAPQPASAHPQQAPIPHAEPAAPVTPQPAVPQPHVPQHPQQQAQPPAPAFGPPRPQFGEQNKFAPTNWGADDDLPDDDLDMDMSRFPKEKKAGPDSFMSSIDDNIPTAPTSGAEPKPLPFAKTPLPKEKDDRAKELKDRRRKEIEELTEEITEEKWKDIMSRVQLVEENIDKLSGDMKNSAIQAQGGGSPKELSAVKNEMANLKEGIEETNARIDSLEDVVKSSLAPMVDSVKKFNRISKAQESSATPKNEAKTEPPLPQAPEVEPPEQPTAQPEAASAMPPRYSPQASKE